MKIRSLSLMALLAASVCLPVRAEEKASSAKLKLSWDSLKTLLRLEGAGIRLSSREYELLLRQTGSAPFASFAGVGGDVTLSREEWERLVASLIPPHPKAPAAVAVRGVYRGSATRDGIETTAEVSLEIPSIPTGGLDVPLFPLGAAFHDLRVDGRPATSRVEQGVVQGWVNLPGSHTVTAKFLVPVRETDAERSFSVSIPRTPLTEWSFEVPEKGVDIRVTPSLYTDLSSTAKGTRVRAILPPTDYVSVAWNPVAPDRDKGPAQIYAVVDSLLSVQEDALRVTSWVDVDVVHNFVNEVRLSVPSGYAVLAVRGEGVKEWQESSDRTGEVGVSLTSARKGRVSLEVDMERVLPGAGAPTKFTGLSVSKALRQRGSVGIDLAADVELPPPTVTGLEPQDPYRELPPRIQRPSRRMVFGYKYARPAFSMEMALARHEAVSVVESVIRQAEGVTVIRPDGKKVHQVTYYLRNASRPFLSVVLPPPMRLWNAFVANVPVKPAAGPSGSILVPVTRSIHRHGEEIPVELVYYEQGKPLSFIGKETLKIPTPDALVAKVQWTVVVPPLRAMMYPGKEFDEITAVVSGEKGGVVGGIVATAGAPAAPDNRMSEECADRSDGDDKLSSIALSVVSKKAAMNGYARGLEFDDSPATVDEKRKEESLVTGALPVRVMVPHVGRRKVFSKGLPESNSVLELPLWQWTEGVAKAAWGGGVLLFLGVAYRCRRLKGVVAARNFIAGQWGKARGRLRHPLVQLFLAAALALAVLGPSLWGVGAITVYTFIAGRLALAIFSDKGDRP